MKRTLILLLSVVAILVIAGYGLATRARRPVGSSGGTYQTVIARRGEIIAKVSATGSVSPRSRTALTFAAPGRLAEIKVSVGEQVQAGQVLASLDARELQQAVAQAEALLNMSQARLALAKKGSAAEEIAAAKANLTSAQETLNQLRAGPSARDLEMARLRWEQAKDQLWGAQCQRDSTAGNPSAPGYLKDQAQASVASAEMAAEIARLQYEQAKEGASATDLRTAEAQVAQAQANLARLTNGPAGEDIRAAQAQVDQNAAALQSAKLRLESAMLTAPFAGVVAAINGRVGEVSSVTAPVLTLVDLSAYQIDVDIDEASIGRIQVGQRVEIALDAFPDQDLSGQITHIDPVGTLSQGLVNYRVTVQLSPADVPIKADMTASVNIVTAHKADAILIPARAVQRDRQGTFVEIVSEGKTRRANVQTGLSSDTDVEIVSGLKEGLRVVTNAPRESPFMGALFGGK